MSSQAGLGRQQPSGRTRVSATGGDNPARLATPARRTLPAPKLGMPADRVPTILVSDTATTTFGEQPEAAETAADTVPPAAVPASVSPAAAAVELVLAPVVRPVSSPRTRWLRSPTGTGLLLSLRGHCVWAFRQRE